MNSFDAQMKAIFHTWLPQLVYMSGGLSLLIAMTFREDFLRDHGV